MSEQQDPFGAGGFDMNSLLKQAQAMQQQMVDAQELLAGTAVQGSAGDGLVGVTVNGTGELLTVSIKKGSFGPEDTEDLEDLVVAAYRDAKSRADRLASQTLGPLAELGGLVDEEGEDPPGGPPRPGIGF